MIPETKQNILERFHDQIEANKAVIGFGAGCGMTAKAAEKGGADFISVYSTAFRRIEGVPSFLAWLPYGDCNEEMRRIAPGILSVIKKTPVIAGIGAHDPRLDLEKIIDEFVQMGFCGISNEPFCSTYGKEFSRKLIELGIGFNRELELLKTAKAKGYITLGWAAERSEAAMLAEAGVDMIGLLAGVDRLSDETEEKYMERTFSLIKEMNSEVKKISPDIITLVHGGPVINVTLTKEAINKTGVDGSATGSGGERIPSEEAILQIVKEYKSIKMP